MDLLYCRIDFGDFGDDMNEWFWEEVFPDYRALDHGTTMLGIGSLLWRQNVEDHERVLVMGSGAGVGVLPNTTDHVTFGFLRGPMTDGQFGLPASAGVTDPACYVPRLREFQWVDGSGDTMLVPHCSSDRLPVDWEKIAGDADMRLVSPSHEPESVIRRIASADLVITESLRGAIIADAFRVPWIPLAISPQFSSFKWLEWGKSIETEFETVSAIAGVKRAYGMLVKLRRRIAGIQRALRPSARLSGRTVRVASAAARSRSQLCRLDASETGRVRALVARHSGRIERILANDLRRARGRRPSLSPDGVVEARQDRIAARIDEVRGGLLAAAS